MRVQNHHGQMQELEEQTKNLMINTGQNMGMENKMNGQQVISPNLNKSDNIKEDMPFKIALDTSKIRGNSRGNFNGDH
jgi:hypothetical protein